MEISFCQKQRSYQQMFGAKKGDFAFIGTSNVGEVIPINY